MTIREALKEVWVEKVSETRDMEKYLEAYEDMLGTENNENEQMILDLTRFAAMRLFAKTLWDMAYSRCALEAVEKLGERGLLRTEKYPDGKFGLSEIYEILHKADLILVEDSFDKVIEKLESTAKE